MVAAEEEAIWIRRRTHVNSTLVKAIARSHRWKRILEAGEYGSVSELAAAEQINPSYLARVLRLTLLAPDIVETVLDGTGRVEITLEKLMVPLPLEWDAQRRQLAILP
jgi:hypothetical protein